MPNLSQTPVAVKILVELYSEITPYVTSLIAH